MEFIVQPPSIAVPTMALAELVRWMAPPDSNSPALVKVEPPIVKAPVEETDI